MVINMKVVEVIDPIYVMEGAGVRLRRSITTQKLDYLDPFLLFDHFGSNNPEDYLAGFPMHPHRGIETVTYILDGSVEHKDSMGNSGIIGKDDVQWMTSGSGIIHEEMPKPKNGNMEGFQLWVNLPANLKMTTPRYQEVKSSQIPEIREENGVVVKIIAGEKDGVKGAVTEIYADPTYLDVTIPPGSTFKHPIKPEHTAFAYVFEGEGIFGDFEEESVDKGTFVPATKLLIYGDGDHIKVKTDKSSVRFLLISGKSLNEPIARYGPFVMNTVEEIEQALKDLQNGTFVK
ncbi:pirin family protein [Methanobacterium spitsbergense]|uniref:Pirin family protein n=1 Tax=Methanobacterium spitsbergense TaxID=2874285 RepID=A0A8T5US23_9EURY|nr:pirin family protein [Methanobacterium spitsbergense]MBZ2166484.1 pirin family protein [Methanobacterium spitsbergense]